ncbi:MAG: Fic family protein [Pseudomonadota bacterium]
MDAQERPVGYTWLIKQFGLTTFPLSHESYIGARARTDATRPGVVREIFLANYWPGDDPFEHLVFALKYDHFNLDVLDQCFARLGGDRVLAHVEGLPNGKYARQLGYLYELLTGEQLALKVAIGGAYADVLDSEKYVVATTPVKSNRWHVNDNMLGSARFCPLVRRTAAIGALLELDFASRLQAYKAEVDPSLFQRAIDYLYFKETRSSFDIERETASPDREQRFVHALREAGQSTFAEVLSESALAGLQNVIVEPRYAQAAFRDWQNYVGESLPGRAPIVHYVCPPGDMVRDLMQGLVDCAGKAQGVHPVVRAALISFGFIFIHPFEDGNGRIHRFLIHDFLGRDGVVPAGMVLPVSAYMLRHAQEYDRALESYSKPLRTVVSISVNEDEQLTVNNPGEASGSYRYPDLTHQAHYLLRAVEQTISTELMTEISFIRGYDRAKVAICDVVDMPNARLDLMIKLLHQNKGSLSKGKRSLFKEITDEELGHIEAVFQAAFAELTIGQDQAHLS